MPHPLSEILDKAVAGRRLDSAEGLALLRSHDLAALGRAADAVTRRLHPEEFRTYNVDRNINYTNICTSGCRFCAFSRKPGDADGYVISRDELHRKIAETVALGGNQILLAGRAAPRTADRVVRGTAPRHQAAFSPGQRPRLQPARGRSHRGALRAAGAGGAGAVEGGGLGLAARRRGGNPRRSRPRRR